MGKRYLAFTVICVRFTAFLYCPEGRHSGGHCQLTHRLSPFSVCSAMIPRVPAADGEVYAVGMGAGALLDAVLQVSSDETCPYSASASHYPPARLRGDESMFQRSRLTHHVCLLSSVNRVGRVREAKHRPAKKFMWSELEYYTARSTPPFTGCKAHWRWPRLRECKR